MGGGAMIFFYDFYFNFIFLNFFSNFVHWIGSIVVIGKILFKKYSVGVGVGFENIDQNEFERLFKGTI